MTLGYSAEAATVKALTMKEAVSLGLKKSTQLRDARTNLLKKRIELGQAQHTVNNEEAKASGPFAKPHNISQDINTRLKVPDARSQLYLAQETLRQMATSERYVIEKAYLTAYQDAVAEERSRQKNEEAKTALDTVKKKRKYGLADSAEQEKADKALEKTASLYKQAQLTAKSSRLALGKLLSLDMENKVQLSFQPDYANLNQRMLPTYLAMGQKTTISLLRDTETRRLADEKLNTTRNLLSSKFGPARMKVMDGLYKDADIDMELFQSSYEETLQHVKEDWQGVFMLFGFIPIPKSLLQGEFDGLRYLDDLTNVLPLATMEQNKAALQEKESRTTVIADVRQSFLEAKGAEEGYAQALRDKDNAVANLAKANQKLKLSLMKADELQAYKDAVDQADAGITAAQIGYKLAIGKLDQATGGAVNRTLRSGILPYRDLDDGLSPVKPQKPKAPLGTWKLKPAVGQLLSDFSVRVSKKLGATDYAVYTKDGKRIGKRTKINKSIRNLSLKFSQIDQLKVVLYKRGKVIGVLPLDGKGSTGQLVDPSASSSNASGAAGGATGDAGGAGSVGDPGGSGAGNAESATSKEGSADGSVDGGSQDSSSTEDGSSTEEGSSDGALNVADLEAEAESTSDKEEGMGTVLIGSYQINLDALTPEAFNAASATIAESGQGMLFKSDAPDASWIGLDNAMDPSALTDPASSAKLSKEQAAALKVTVAIMEPGKIASTETPAQLQKKIDTLKTDITKLEADKEAAVAAMKLNDIADLAVQIKDAQAQLGMLEALLKGDSQAALKQMALVNNPDALIAALAEEASPAEPGDGTGEGGDGNPAATNMASEDQLAEQAELQQAKLEQALAAGEPEAAAAALQQLLATQAQLADAQTGASEGQASLNAAKQKLQAALSAAQAQKDTERVATLTRSLEAVAAAKLAMAKDALFAKLEAAQLLLAELPPDSVVGAQLEQQVTNLLSELQQQEKAKYAPEELQALASIAESLANVTSIPGPSTNSSGSNAASESSTASSGTEVPVTIQPLSAENVLSSTMSIKFDAPPVIINGGAYLPIRSVSESFGAAVDWDQESLTVTVSTEYTTITSTINQTTAYVDGLPTPIDGPSLLLEGRTYVPLRFISESLGFGVEWNAALQMIQIDK
ncbi:copper amine oxidase N-terminal domain-containing protein [Paenibacillus roseipurpureus]|uniref:Copper amine oxidase N-terminal domain-containing protein n=1 Tax=Paenibacillus roseopurpureus TaxID=2918901 RepID=A0AA96LLM2_9BACL|nr:copper amine oxidase N-terminal domain-containing protein [Paenibacillus sp. MBLB1832]WNR44025.1 copper amine oxidase N-terminal domain-containing protein [Paenibacillus sp. MBLB1832]